MNQRYQEILERMAHDKVNPMGRRKIGGASCGGAPSGGAPSGGRKRRAPKKKAAHKPKIAPRKRGGYAEDFVEFTDDDDYEGGAVAKRKYGKNQYPKKKAAARRNPWIEFIKTMAAKDGLTYSETLAYASYYRPKYESWKAKHGY